jgi:hypothetical protein
MEQWNDGPPWCYPVLTASSGIISWIAIRKLTNYEFGLGQGLLGPLVFHLVEK